MKIVFITAIVKKFKNHIDIVFLGCYNQNQLKEIAHHTFDEESRLDPES